MIETSKHPGCWMWKFIETLLNPHADTTNNDSLFGKDLLPGLLVVEAEKIATERKLAVLENQMRHMRSRVYDPSCDSDYCGTCGPKW